MTGLLGLPLPASLETRFLTGTGAEITFRRDAYPTRFVGAPGWDERGEHIERWAFLGRGVLWVKGALERGIEVVWSSRYEQYANTYFSPALGLPELPVATTDDGRFHTTEADWKASQLSQAAYADRPLLWVHDELTSAGRHLLERYRKPKMRALTWSRFIPGGASDGDVRFMDEWLRHAVSPAGHAELRAMRARLVDKRRRLDLSTERVQREWATVRSRLADVVDAGSGLAAPLAAYAVDSAGALDLRVVERIREDWGLPVDPPAEALLPLLDLPRGTGSS
ncbi:hypothetical protein [Microbacterium sp. Marseille-Q6648]|uniref:hypothetical protein n=1 Tax=Microbacterium sp. Marseille-Q6648 TaxID=2937991 RepID=UPI00203C5593|nr:hypothetical protein [Microbacterium sp. Marseille-Q6648]